MAAIDWSAFLTSALVVFLFEFFIGWKRKGQIEVQVARRIAELTRLHEKRLEVLSKLSGLLWKLRKAVLAYTGPKVDGGWAPAPQLREAAASILAELDEFLAQYRCLISSETYKHIKGFRDALNDVVLEYLDNVEAKPSRDSTPEERTAARAAVESARRVVMEETPDLLNRIDDDFRAILGVIEPEALAGRR